MNSSDGFLEYSDSNGPNVTHRAFDDDKYISPNDRQNDDEILANLLATASVALHSDYQLTQRCIQRAVLLLGIDLRSAESTAGVHPGQQGGLSWWQVKRIRGYIEGKLDSGIRATDLARLAQLSTSHFSRAFRKTFGESPLKFVMRQRMQRAQLLMSTSRTPLSQVALECGMCDQAHFSRSFRRVVGISPSAWRRRVPAHAAAGENISKKSDNGEIS